MLFNSVPFALFFAGYLAVYALCPARHRLGLMIAGSATFYGYWNWAYAGLPVGLALAAFWLTNWTAVAAPEQRRARLAVSVAALLLPLLFFKYTNFLWNEFVAPFGRAAGLSIGPKVVDLGLPLGISFVTFTLIAYLVDVARRQYPQPRLRLLLGYVLFFPHLIAGPILRPRELIPQLQRGMPIRRNTALPGLAVFAVGLVKKMVVADPIGSLVASIYAHAPTATTVEVLFAIYGFSVQIYCDFSGYTDMAIGLALIFGVRLPSNFRRPYVAVSIGDFWRRWHITLSHWLRDYVYIALGGNREGRARTAVNVLITMALGGLWHGANWTFVIWGILHGVGVALTHLLAPRIPRWAHLPRVLQIVVTFHIVALLWVFFRSPDLSTAHAMIGGVLGKAPLGDPLAFVAGHPFECLLLPLFLLAHGWDDNRRLRWIARRAKPLFVVVGVIALVLFAVAIGADSSAQFIYFDF